MTRIKHALLSAFELSAVDVVVFSSHYGLLAQQLYEFERLNGVPDPLQPVVGLPV